MKKYQSINIIVVLLFVSIFTAQAQEERNQGIIWSYLHGWEYGIKAGFSIGGTSPLPLPKEIRKIMQIADGDPLEIYLEKYMVCFKKYLVTEIQK